MRQFNPTLECARALDADFAIWCNYKYLNGGPGAIAGLYINRKHFERIPGLTGWHGNRADTKFELRLDFEHEKRASGWQTGTQPLLSMAPLNGALKIYGETSMATVREKSLNLTAYMMYLIDEKLTKYGFSVGNPRDDAVRGGHVALEHEDAIRINEAIKAAGWALRSGCVGTRFCRCFRVGRWSCWGLVR